MSQPLIGPQNFRDESDEISPTTWNGPNGKRVRYSMSVLFDDVTQMAIYAVQAQAPSIAPADALPYISADRRVFQGFQESNASFRARAVQWLDRAAYLGKPTGVLLGARGWILPSMPQIAVITQNGQWWGYGQDFDPMPAGTQTVTPASIHTGTWDWDTLPATFWAQSWLVVWSSSEPWCTGNIVWGAASGAWGSGKAWGFDQSPSIFTGLTAVLADTKADHVKYPFIIVSFSNLWYQFSSDSTHSASFSWGNWHKVVNGVAVPARDTTVSRFVTGAS